MNNQTNERVALLEARISQSYVDIATQVPDSFKANWASYVLLPDGGTVDELAEEHEKLGRWLEKDRNRISVFLILVTFLPVFTCAIFVPREYGAITASVIIGAFLILCISSFVLSVKTDRVKEKRLRLGKKLDEFVQMVRGLDPYNEGPIVGENFNLAALGVTSRTVILEALRARDVCHVLSSNSKDGPLEALKRAAEEACTKESTCTHFWDAIKILYPNSLVRGDTFKSCKAQIEKELQRV